MQKPTTTRPEDPTDMVNKLIFKLEPERQNYELQIQITSNNLDFLTSQMSKLDNSGKQNTFDILQIAMEKKVFELQIQLTKNTLEYLVSKTAKLDQEIADKKFILGILQSEKQ